MKRRRGAGAITDTFRRRARLFADHALWSGTGMFRWTTSSRRQITAGGAVTLRLALWAIPFSFRYQLARRATDDNGTVHLVTLGP